LRMPGIAKRQVRAVAGLTSGRALIRASSADSAAQTETNPTN
jgi:hypothetical protein